MLDLSLSDVQCPMSIVVMVMICYNLFWLEDENIIEQYLYEMRKSNRKHATDFKLPYIGGFKPDISIA